MDNNSMSQRERQRVQNRAYYASHRDALVQYQRDYRALQREKATATARASYARRRDTEIGKKRAKRLTAPQKHRAQDIAKAARKRGILTVGTCEVGTGCLGEMQAHHDDYAKPLDVRWLCKRHHQQWHVQHGEGANASLPVAPPRVQCAECGTTLPGNTNRTRKYCSRQCCNRVGNRKRAQRKASAMRD